MSRRPWERGPLLEGRGTLYQNDAWVASVRYRIQIWESVFYVNRWGTTVRHVTMSAGSGWWKLLGGDIPLDQAELMLELDDRRCIGVSIDGDSITTHGKLIEPAPYPQR